MTVAVLVMTDGRDSYLDRSVQSIEKKLRGPIQGLYMHDDTGDDAYRARLAEAYPDYVQIGEGPRRGFGGAISWAWQWLASNGSASFVWHAEADFVYNHDVDLNAMIRVLNGQPHLAQMALRRQAWAPAEIAAGGVVEQHPEAYTDCADGESAWLSSRIFYTTNPSLIRRSLVGRGWPDVPHSESAFTQHLLRVGTPEATPEQVRFGYWGARDSGTWVQHIGDERAGHGY